MSRGFPFNSTSFQRRCGVEGAVEEEGEGLSLHSSGGKARKAH